MTEQKEQYLRWLWMPAQCCPAAVRCTQPVCAACLAPVPSPGHCRICQQASGSARSSRSYQGLQQTNRAKRGGSHQWEKQEVKQRTEWDRIRKREHHDNIACNVFILYNCLGVLRKENALKPFRKEHIDSMYSVKWQWMQPHSEASLCKQGKAAQTDCFMTEECQWGGMLHINEQGMGKLYSKPELNAYKML